MDELFYENLDYGFTQLADDVLFEDAKYVGAPFNRLQFRKIRLPDGKGNIVYLLSDTFANCIQLIQNKYFSYPFSYLKLFYPQYLGGMFMKRRFRYKVRDKRDRDSLLRSNTKLRPYGTRTLLKGGIENVFFTVSDIYENTKRIVESLSIKRAYSEYIPELCRILKENTPEKSSDGKANCGNRILIIDADTFKFTSSTKLSDVKSNPLYLLYLAFLRNRDLTKLNVDMDMLICSHNLFMKFNPSRLSTTDWGNFRKGLFTICKRNLDDLTEEFPEEEKKQLEETAKDVIMTNIIKERIKPFVKNVSGSTKAVLQDAVEKKIRTKIAQIVKKDEEIKKTKEEVAKKIGVKSPTKVDKKDAIPVNRGSSLIHRNVVKDPLTDKQASFFKTIAGQYMSLATPTGQTIKIEDEQKTKAINTNLADIIEPEKIPNNKPKKKDEEIPGEIDQKKLSEDDFDDSRYDDVDLDEVDIDKEKMYKDEFDDVEDDIADDVQEVLQDEDIASEVLDEIQSNTVPIKTSTVAPINSERDKKLREEQKKVVVRSETIEQILERDTNNVKVEEKDLSKILHTTNQNLYKMKFGNFEKTYIKNLFLKDIVAVFDSLKDKETPFYITNIDIKDTSTTLDYKDTWTVSLKDETGKRHTLKVDIPKFMNDRFMWIQGTKYMILKQNFYNPLVKDTPDVVILTTNFNKITMRRRATKSFNSIERLFSLLKKSEDDKIFIIGDSSKTNLKYISTLEYDELSRRIFKFEANGCKLYFSRDYIHENLLNENIKPKGNEFFIGYEGKDPIYINEDTGLDRGGRTIIEIIENHLPEKYAQLYSKAKGPTQSMYAECKAAGQVIPVAACLVAWDGLSQTLQNLRINWRFIPNVTRMPKPSSSHRYIRFADGVLEYEAKTYAELILNGLTKLHPEQFTFAQADTEEFYDEFIYSTWGSYNGINELKHFKEFLIDPITKSVCKDMFLPDTASGLVIHGVKLLCDNAFVSKASDKSYRVRSIEIIPAILYNHINAQYKAHIKSGRKLPMSIRQNCVLQTLVTDIPTVEAYSTLSPAIEVHKAHTISTKGYKGSNSEYSYDEEKRSYDPSSIGKLTTVTSADKNVGILHELAIEPTISNARGYREEVQDINDLKDINVFSPIEQLTPCGGRGDDAIRTSISAKQACHTIPVEDASYCLVSNGYDEAVQFNLSDDFVINAEEDGKVIDINPELGFQVVKYKSGKTKAISLKPEIVHNSGGGFYMPNQMKLVHTRIGETFKKDEPLAYHEKFFRYTKMHGLRYAFGPLTKIALMSMYSTYEDSGICSEDFGKRMRTAIVYQETAKFKKNNNILYMAKIGDHVGVGDALIKYDIASEDNEIAKYLSKLSADNAALLEEETKSELKTMHAGKIIDIKVYTLLTPENLSESLGKVVKDYFDMAKKKSKYLSQFDDSDGVVKAGYMLTDAAEPIKNKYNQIKGIKGADVVIEFYIEHEDVLGVGDKLAVYGPNKQVVSEVIPKGYEMFSEFRPEEEISLLLTPGTISRRMTISIVPVMTCTKVLIELKRKIKDMIKY